MDKRAIGVFDSGLGGLTAVRRLHALMPQENIIYFGDTARVPYGVKSVATIEHFTQQIADFLLQQQVKVLIIACNTMAAVASQVVKEKAGAIPVLDVIDAGARAAVVESRSRAIGVIGTPTTVNSNAYARRMHGLDSGVRVYSQACPLFVPLVEEGWLEHEVTRLTAQEYLKPVLAENVDTLVLGCTHYPLLRPIIQNVMGKGVKLIDSGAECARDISVLLNYFEINRSREVEDKTEEYYTTASVLGFKEIAEQWLGEEVAVQHVDLDKELEND